MNALEIAEALRVLETNLPRDIEEALARCLDGEEGNSRDVMKAIVENVKYARDRKIPMCQDTGSLAFFVKCNRGLKGISEAIENGIRLATKAVPLRANTVNPFSRCNEGSNLGRGNPIVHFEVGSEDEVEMAIMAKGAGSENVSRVFMLNPDEGIEGLKYSILESVRKAGAKPCPPVIVGIGVGGTLDWAAYLSKKALLRPLDDHADDPTVAQLEDELLKGINGMKIGPMGFGGKTTSLGVKVEWAYCHTASLPVSVNIQCWALRKVFAHWKGDEFRITW